MCEENALQGRILIFVLTYQAEKHIAGVFETIPDSFFNCQEVHFLVIDDASEDASAEIVSQWLDEHEVLNATVLRNPVNQGYGGNQKLGYRLAVDAGFDFVVMLHGDGQYAPESLPEFCRIWREERADVVLGSRMHSLKSARRRHAAVQDCGQSCVDVDSEFFDRPASVGIPYRLPWLFDGFPSGDSFRNQYERFSFRHRNPSAGAPYRRQSEGVSHCDPVR